MKKWKILNKQIAFDNKWLIVRKDTVELANGKIIDDFYVWEGLDVVMIVPITPDKKFVMVKQYKHGIEDITIEYPAGYIENKNDIENEGKRELAEETGYTSDKISFLSKYTANPSKATAMTHIYLAENAQKTTETQFDDNEEIETLLITANEVMALIHEGRIINSSVVAATYLVIEKLNLR